MGIRLLGSTPLRSIIGAVISEFSIDSLMTCLTTLMSVALMDACRSKKYTE